MDADVPLPTDVPTLQAMVRTLQARVSELEPLVETVRQLREELAQLKAKFEKSQKERSRRKSERTRRPPKADAENGQETRHKHGRAKLPEHLERRDILLELSPEEQRCSGCGYLRDCIGHTATEQLDREPVKFFVRRTLRKTYACQTCSLDVPADQRIQTARPATVGPIEKGLCGPGLLADVIVSKYLDHIPLHRQVGIIARSGVKVAESTLGDWIAQSARLLQPLTKLMHQRVLSCPVAWSDDTRSRYAQRGESVMPKGYFWVTIGDATAPYTIFHFSTTHDAATSSDLFLQGFAGYLHADGLSQYNRLYAGNVRHVACWAHARSKFFQAGEPAKVPFEFIQDLYRIERKLPPPDTPEQIAERKAIRQTQAFPILAKFKAWLDGMVNSLLPKDALRVAIGYVRNRWEAFVRYTEDGRLSIDNNLSERTLRLIAVGRGNWKFQGNAQAGVRSAVLYTITGTCRHLGLDALAYLGEVLPALHALGENPGVEQLRPLLPDEWAKRQQTLQRAA